MKEAPQPTVGVVTWSTICYYLTVGSVFLILKLFHRISETDQLRFLLSPVSWLVDVANGTHSVYIEHKGYFSSSFNIVIDKSCSGFNFWIICFMSLSVLLAKHVKNAKHRFVLLPALLALCYLLTLWVNAARISFSLFMNNMTTSTGTEYTWLHQTEGTLIYLFFLVLIYVAVDYLLTKIFNKHAKLS